MYLNKNRKMSDFPRSTVKFLILFYIFITIKATTQYCSDFYPVQVTIMARVVLSKPQKNRNCAYETEVSPKPTSTKEKVVKGKKVYPNIIGRIKLFMIPETS